MPELTLSLEADLLKWLKQEAERSGATPEHVASQLLREHLPAVPSPGDARFPRSASPQELLRRLSDSDSKTRQQAQEKLAALGSSILPELESALPTVDQPTLVSIATALAVSGTSSAIYPLLTAYALGDARHKPALFHETRVLLGRFSVLPESAWAAIQKTTLRTVPLVAYQLQLTLNLLQGARTLPQANEFRRGSTPAEIESLVSLLSWQRTSLPARCAAAALEQIALSAPTPLLRQALPLLRPAWYVRFAHPELVQAMKTIETATALWKDLPLVTSAEFVSQGSLPVPAETSEVSVRA